MDINVVLTVVSLLMSVLAFGLTLYGIRQANIGIRQSDESFRLATKHEARMAEQVAKISEIAASVPTRASASFADHLAYIVRLIEETKGGSIRILTDCADYGSFFDPKNHKEMVDALIAAARRGVRVEMLAGGPLQPITQSSAFNGRPFGELLKLPHFKAHLSTYLDHVRADLRFKDWLRTVGTEDVKRLSFCTWLAENEANRERPDIPLDGAMLAPTLAACMKVFARSDATIQARDAMTFDVLLLAREKYFEEYLQRYGVDIERITSYSPIIFFWLRAGAYPQEAAFIFAQADREALGAAMTTVDLNFINLFTSIFQRQWTKAKST
jgi:hypothetical protein